MNTNGSTVRGICARAKVVAAAIAAGVVVTMGAMTVALSGTQAHAVTEKIGGAGNTRTETTPPSTRPVTMPVPALKAHKWPRLAGQ